MNQQVPEYAGALSPSDGQIDYEYNKNVQFGSIQSQGMEKKAPRRHISFQGEPTRPPGFRYPRRNASFHADLLRPAVMCSIDCQQSSEGSNRDDLSPFSKPQKDPSDCGLTRSRSYTAKRSRRVSTMYGEVEGNNCDDSDGSSVQELTDSLRGLTYDYPSPPIPLRRRISSIRRAADSAGFSPSNSFNSEA